jgi:glycosyltransferase involved in cell wall biosynthesis
MRIGFDATWYNESGVGTYIAGLLKALAQHGEDIELIVFEDRARPVRDIEHLDVARVPMRSSKFSLGEQLEFREHCKQRHVDVFHTPYQYGVPLFLPCPLVTTVHDLIPLLFRTRDWHKQIMAMPLVRLGCRVAAFRARHIIADSTNTARDVERILGAPASRVTPVHLAAASDVFHSTASPNEREALAAKYGLSFPYAVVGSAGCNWRTKNLDAALESLALARRRSESDFQVAIYGPRTAIEKVRNKTLLSELDIRYLGYVPVEDMGALFRHAHLFIMTSLYEGFGLPILEAMSCGCPVITSNGGSLAEVAANGAQVFCPWDTAGMSHAVALLLGDTAERERWRTRAHARASHFSWEKAAEQTLAVYRRVYDSVSVEKHEGAHEAVGAVRGGHSA